MAQRWLRSCTIKPRVEHKLRLDAELWGQVTRYLQAGYLSKQIAGTLVAVHLDSPSLQVSHETIYAAIYAMPCGELRTEVTSWLRFGHAKRRPCAWGEDRRGQIPEMASIHHRPPVIEEQLIPDTEKAISSRAHITALRLEPWLNVLPYLPCWPGWTMPVPHQRQRA